MELGFGQFREGVEGRDALAEGRRVLGPEVARGAARVGAVEPELVAGLGPVGTRPSPVPEGPGRRAFGAGLFEGLLL